MLPRRRHGYRGQSGYIPSVPHAEAPAHVPRGNARSAPALHAPLRNEVAVIANRVASHADGNPDAFQPRVVIRATQRSSPRPQGADRTPVAGSLSWGSRPAPGWLSNDARLGAQGFLVSPHLSTVRSPPQGGGFPVRHRPNFGLLGATCDVEGRHPGSAVSIRGRLHD